MQAAASPSQHAPPGTAAYLPGLVARAIASHPDLPIEPTVFQSLLLCLIAQPRLPLGSVKPSRSSGPGVHLILRTKEEDVGLVVNLAALVSADLVSLEMRRSSRASSRLSKCSSDIATYPGSVYPQAQDSSQGTSIFHPFAIQGTETGWPCIYAP